MNTSNKRIRSTNFSKEEQLILLEEIRKYKKIIENKATNKVSCSEKVDAWKCIEKSFNSKVSAYRTLQQLQSKYENLKSEARKISANERLGLRGTGGGPYKNVKDDPIITLVLELVNIKTVVGFSSQFDSDAVTEENVTEKVTIDCPADFLLDQHNDDPNADIIHTEDKSTSIFFLEQPTTSIADNEVPFVTEIINSSNASSSKCLKRNLPLEELETLNGDDADGCEYACRFFKENDRVGGDGVGEGKIEIFSPMLTGRRISWTYMLDMVSDEVAIFIVFGLKANNGWQLLGQTTDSRIEFEADVSKIKKVTILAVSKSSVLGLCTKKLLIRHKRHRR